MTLYGVLLFIHVVAAVCGLGATFALPPLNKLPKNVSQARFAMAVSKQVEKLAKIGSITLLLTGLILGWVHPYLFQQFWYIASLVIYVLLQPIVAGVFPKKMKRKLEVLGNADGEELPEEYYIVSNELKPYEILANTSAVILLLLMTIKPF